jgi:hypothetical protein
MKILAFLLSAAALYYAIKIGYYAWLKQEKLLKQTRNFRSMYRDIPIYGRLSSYMNEHPAIDIIGGKVISLLCLIFALACLVAGISDPLGTNWIIKVLNLLGI